MFCSFFMDVSALGAVGVFRMVCFVHLGFILSLIAGMFGSLVVDFGGVFTTIVTVMHLIYPRVPLKWRYRIASLPSQTFHADFKSINSNRTENPTCRCIPTLSKRPLLTNPNCQSELLPEAPNSNCEPYPALMRFRLPRIFGFRLDVVVW